MAGSSKTCTKCKETLSLSAFHKRQASKDGLRARCKSCCKKEAVNRKEYHKNYSIKYYQENKEQYQKYNKQWREENKERITIQRKEYWHKNKEALNSNSRIRNYSLKKEVFNYYGDMCKCCGETEIAFLSIDHINEDGANHRKLLTGSSRTGGGTPTYRWIKKNNFPDGFQVLCFNCNWAKSHGGCPHQNTSKLAATQS